MTYQICVQANLSPPMEPKTPQHQLAQQMTAARGDSSASLFSQAADNPFFTAV